MRRQCPFVLLLIVVLLLAACGEPTSEQSSEGTVAPAAGTKDPAAAPATGEPAPAPATNQ